MFKVKAHKPYPLSWWCRQANNIDTSPKYQRKGKLWSASKQAGLIDSIINEFDMPKLYLADFTEGTTPLKIKQKPYAVIDGKQRLESIFSFFNNTLKLNDDFVYFDNTEIKIGGLYYNELRQKHPDIALRFDRHIPAIMSVFTDDELKIKELFVRLNSGVAANSAERRNAMAGKASEMIRKLAKHTFFKENIAFNVSRLAENSVAAKLLLIEYHGRFTDTKASHLDRLTKAEYSKPDMDRLEEACNMVIKILNQMSKGFGKKDKSLSAAGSIPIYYWLYRSNSAHAKLLPNFIREFSESIKENLKISKLTPSKADPVLSQYYTMGRTTNDQASLVGRSKIIQDLFETHILTS